MLFHILGQFIVELLRALLIDEISQRVRRRIMRGLADRTSRQQLSFYLSLRRRSGQKLLHKLRTLPDKDVQ